MSITRSDAWQTPSLLLRAAMRRAPVGPLLTFLLLAAIALAASWTTSREVERIAAERFAFKVSEVQFAIEQRLLAYEQVLRGGIGLFASSEEVTRDEWRTYVESIDIGDNYLGIQGIGFAKRILPAELSAHVHDLREGGFPDYNVWPDGDRSEYTSIIYLEPFDWRNQRAFGYDMFSEPVRQEAMRRARDSALPTVSGKVTLVQETNEAVQSGFLMYLPFYRPEMPRETQEQRQAALFGYVYAPFRMHDLMQGILGPGRLPIIRLEIFDGDSASQEHQMYDSEVARRDLPRATSFFTIDKPFVFNGRRWTMRFSSLPSFDSSIDDIKPRLILFGGLVVSALFAAIVWALSLNRRRARELSIANHGLEAEIAERRKLESALKDAKNAAEAASQAKSEFLANVSHELRTPLTLILAPLEQLLDSPHSPPGVQRQLERMQRNAIRLLNRVNDLLDFSKAEAGKLAPDWQTVNLVEQVPVLAGDAIAAAEKKGCTLKWYVDPSLEAVLLDPQHFEKIGLNLVSNAIKFTPSGGWIELRVVPADGDRFELSVVDSGIGIPQAKLPLLFERFQQLDSSATRRHGGTGIGLALVKELAEQMGGSVSAQSSVGNGSTFTVQLPRRSEHACVPASGPEVGRQRGIADATAQRLRLEEDNCTVPPAASAVLQECSLRFDGAAPRVMVVDDSADMRDYIAELLEDDYDVLRASEGLQAWALLQHHAIDVVVSDVMMPRLDGFGLVARMKSSPQLAHIPAILVTARGGGEASVAGLDTGADDYLVKPFLPAELKARVRAALRMAQVQVELRERSREAGMAMIAAGILHNLGNILSSLAVASDAIERSLGNSALPRLAQVATLMAEQGDQLPQFLVNDNRGKAVLSFLSQLSGQLSDEQATISGEVQSLRRYLQHAMDIVTSQKGLATNDGALPERISVSALMEAALALCPLSFEAHGIRVEYDRSCTTSVVTDRYKVVQILLSLLINAHQALRESPHAERWMRLGSELIDERVRLKVSDNGAGVARQDLPLLFDQSFGSGVSHLGCDLHSSAIWARTLGGALTCHSEGLGRGATFTLELPATWQDSQSAMAEGISVGIDF